MLRQGEAQSVSCIFLAFLFGAPLLPSSRAECSDVAGALSMILSHSERWFGPLDAVVFIQWNDEESTLADSLVHPLLQRDVPVSFLHTFSPREEIAWMQDRHRSFNALIVPGSDVDERFLEAASARGLMERSAWLLPGGLHASTLKLRLDSKLFTYDCDGSGGVSIKEVYAVKSVHKFENVLAMWNSTDGVFKSPSDPFMWNRRANLSAVSLTNTGNDWDEFYKRSRDNPEGK